MVSTFSKNHGFKHVFKSSLAASAALATVVTLSGASGAASAQSGPLRQTVITNVTASPVNGGINPSFAAVEIAGDVMLGENPCIAAGATAELRLRRRGRDVIVIPYVRLAPDEEDRVCIQIFDPVYVSLSTVVRVNAAVVNGVLVANVDEKGNTVRVHEFR